MAYRLRYECTVGPCQISAPFRDGGPAPIQFTFTAGGSGGATGGATLNPSDANYDWLFPTTTGLASGGRPLKGQVDIQLDANLSGQIVVREALLYDMTIDAPLSVGGEMPVVFRMIADEGA